jgi:hypothetical protein
VIGDLVSFAGGACLLPDPIAMGLYVDKIVPIFLITFVCAGAVALSLSFSGARVVVCVFSIKDREI